MPDMTLVNVRTTPGGPWVQVPAIVGPQGPRGVQGPPGDDGIIESATAPTDTTKFWRDTTENKIKYYDAAAQQWKAVGSGGGGGASTWSEVQNKPFSTIGSGLTVENDVLKATGGGGSDMTDDEALDYAYELGLVEPYAQSGYVLFTTADGKIFVS